MMCFLIRFSDDGLYSLWDFIWQCLEDTGLKFTTSDMSELESACLGEDVVTEWVSNSQQAAICIY